MRGTATGNRTRRESFAALTQPRLDRAYRLAAAILSGEDEAQDAVHDAAVRAWTHWADLRDPAVFDAWFDRILVNVCRDRLRRRVALWRRLLSEPRPVTVGSTGQDVAEIGVLSEAFDKLTPDHKVAIALRFLEDLPLEEISRRTGARVGTVKSRIHYGVRELRAAYMASERFRS